MTDQSSPMHTSKEERSKFWQSHLEIWKNSGLSQAEYCRQNSLKSRIFNYWKVKFSSEESPLEFVEVIADSTPSIPSIPLFNNRVASLRLTVNNRFTIEIPDGFSTTTLRQVLQTLQEV